MRPFKWTYVFGAAVVVVAALLVMALMRRSESKETSEAEESKQPTEVAVKVGKIERATLRAYVSGYGTVDPEPATPGLPPASAKIGSPVAGLLSEARAVEGQRVAKGTVLFQLDSRVADAQVAKAQQAAEFADRALARQKTLLDVDATSQKAYQEADALAQAAHNDVANAQAQRALLTIRAPITGTVTKVSARPGDSIDVTTVLAEMVDLERLVVSAKIRSADVGVLRRGQPAEVAPGRAEAPEQVAITVPPVSATVSYISSAVDSANDTVVVRASLPRDTVLRPGQFVTVRILYDEHRDKLAVPIDSVVTDANGQGAFIAVVSNNEATKRPVTVGIKDNGLAEIEGSGLNEGTAIVASGAYGLPEKTRIKPIAQ